MPSADDWLQRSADIARNPNSLRWRQASRALSVASYVAGAYCLLVLVYWIVLTVLVYGSDHARGYASLSLSVFSAMLAGAVFISIMTERSRVVLLITLFAAAVIVWDVVLLVTIVREDAMCGDPMPPAICNETGYGVVFAARWVFMFADVLAIATLAVLYGALRQIEQLDQLSRRAS